MKTFDKIAATSWPRRNNPSVIFSKQELLGFFLVFGVANLPAVKKWKFNCQPRGRKEFSPENKTAATSGLMLWGGNFVKMS